MDYHVDLCIDPRLLDRSAQHQVTQQWSRKLPTDESLDVNAQTFPSPPRSTLGQKTTSEDDHLLSADHSQPGPDPSYATNARLCTPTVVSIGVFETPPPTPSQILGVTTGRVTTKEPPSVPRSRCLPVADYPFTDLDIEPQSSSLLLRTDAERANFESSPPAPQQYHKTLVVRGSADQAYDNQIESYPTRATRDSEAASFRSPGLSHFPMPHYGNMLGLRSSIICNFPGAPSLGDIATAAFVRKRPSTERKQSRCQPGACLKQPSSAKGLENTTRRRSLQGVFKQPQTPRRLAMKPDVRRHSDPQSSAQRPLVFMDNDFTLRTDTVGLKSSKGKRSGPLDVTTKALAALCRKGKLACIRCRIAKQTCYYLPGSACCTRCENLGPTAMWPQPCTKAHFLDIPVSGTCNYISQLSANPLSLDGRRRVRLDLPVVMDLTKTLEALEARRATFGIRVRQSSGAVYNLDLEKCYHYLKKLQRNSPRAQQPLRSFIDHDVLSANDWSSCVKGCDISNDLLGVWTLWQNMPSRANYAYVPSDVADEADGGQSIDLDPENAQHLEDIYLAAQLSRIMCRKLEIDAYSHLQHVLNNWHTIAQDVLLKFVHQLGLILLNLRFRVSGWSILGGGGSDDAGKQKFEERVTTLCRILYFYYCSIRSKLVYSAASQDQLQGVYGKHIDTSFEIFDDFPGIASIEGFHAWMQRGRELVVCAGVADKLASLGLQGQRQEES